MSVRITEQDTDDIRLWFQRHTGYKWLRLDWSPKCLHSNHLVGSVWKAERNRQWMLGILRRMEEIKAKEFFGERQRLLARNYPKP